MTIEEYNDITDKLQGNIRFLYLHLMGEPFLNGSLARFVHIAKEKGMLPIVTTNGTRFAGRDDVLNAVPYKLQVSLHAHEGNGKDNPEQYMQQVMEYAIKAAQLGTIVVLRLWNGGGYNTENEHIKDIIASYIPRPWSERYDGYMLTKNLYLEYGDMFEWPEESKDVCTDKLFCYALRNQVGILVDGTVVPCCLDHDGDMALGNIHSQSLDEILHSDRAQAIYNGFTMHKAVEPLCQRCGYTATRQ